MRRKEKFIINSAAIFGSITAIGDILLQWFEHYEKGEKFSWEKFNGIRTIKRSLIGSAVGAGLGYAYYIYKLSEEEKLPFNPDNYLNNILRDELLSSDPQLLKLTLEKRSKVKEWLLETFGDDLVAPPEDSGSFKKRTAIVSNFDLDLVLPFRKGSYNALEEMYDDVYYEIFHKFSATAIVTKQTKAIGLTFNIHEKEIHFDIVPGREISNYHKDKDLNLYVNPQSIWQKGSSFKTNLKIQKSITVNKPQVRKVIKLLKSYKDRNGIPLPSLLIEQCVTEALSKLNYGIDTSITENLLNSMDYIASRLDNKVFLDKANSNNNLHDKLSNIERDTIKDQLWDDVERIKNNPRYLREVFEH